MAGTVSGSGSIGLRSLTVFVAVVAAFCVCECHVWTGFDWLEFDLLSVHSVVHV